MTLNTIAVVDFGMGNLRSVQNAEHVGGHFVVVNKPNELQSCDKILLPGVGAFSQAIDCLHRQDLPMRLMSAERLARWILVSVWACS